MASTSKRVEKAEKYVQKGKLADALDEYLHAFQEDPSNDSVVEIISELYLRLNQPKKAVECYGYLFDKRVEQNDGRAALLMFRKMARLGPPDPARLLICARFQEKQKPLEARDSYHLCAQLFEQQGDKAKVLEALRGLASLEDGNIEVHVRLAETAESVGQKDVAAQALLRAGEVLRGAGGGSLDRAIGLLEKARALTPGDVRVSLALAAALLEAGKPNQVEEVLEPVAPESSPERNRLLAAACLAQNKLEQAEELLWKMVSSFPDVFSDLLRVLDAYLAAGLQPAASELFCRLRSSMGQVKKDRLLAEWLDALLREAAHSVPVLEFILTALRELNRESELSQINARLFDACLGAGDYVKAATVLHRLVDLSAPEEENQGRLEHLKGKLDESAYRELAARILPAEAAPPAAPDSLFVPSEAPVEPVGELDDMILQAEMLLQFGGKEQGTEYLRGIAERFPGQETRNERLRTLYVEAGLPVSAAPAAPGAPPSLPPTTPEAAPAVDVRRLSEIMRAIQRQTATKAALSTAVNEVGKTWGASRCLASLCQPGKLPTAAIEYCAPGVKPSDVSSVTRLVPTLVQMVADGNPRSIDDAASCAELARVAPVVNALGVRSILVVPLMDAEQAVGAMVLQQCEQARRWPPGEVVLLKSVADRVVLTTAQIKLQSLVKAVSDDRSGLLSRGAYLDCLVTECGRARKEQQPLSAALLQFGKGQASARELGQEKFERFLQQAVQELVSHLPENDVGVRYDSVTLALIFPNTRGADMAAAVERIRRMLAGITIDGHAGLPLTAGVAEAAVSSCPDPVDAVTELINRLEAALDEAQRQPGSSRLLPIPSRTAAIR
jgi:GGDEF domain-containing protein/tetratricopeptide (TPR) repeat protein